MNISFRLNGASFQIKDDKPITWKADDSRAVALLDRVISVEMRLIHPPTAMNDQPAVLSNIIYWGAPRHDGFIMMPNEIQAYREGENQFESSGSNGFMITVDINSDDV